MKKHNVPNAQVGDCFCFQVQSPKTQANSIKQPGRKHLRLRLLILTRLRRVISCCRLYYLPLSKPSTGPSVAHSRINVSVGYVPTECAFGGPGRNRTAVQKSFALKGLQQY